MRPAPRRFFLIVALTCLTCLVHASVWAHGGGDAGAAAKRVAEQFPGVMAPSPLAPAVQAAISELRGAASTADWSGVDEFYSRLGHQPAWMPPEGRQAARVLVTRMRAAEDDGLRAVDYDSEGWARRLEMDPRSVDDALARDVQLTAVLLRFASDLARGIAADSVRTIDVSGTLAAARDGASAREVLSLLEPRHAEYRHLREALRQYRAAAEAGGWLPVPLPRGVLLARDGEPADPEVLHRLCERLAATGDLPGGREQCGPDGGLPREYGKVLEEAVRSFQARHGLTVDGVVGPRTIAALNMPVEGRIAQIALNMDRWRRLPDDLGNRHVRVNIPGFSLQGVDGRERALTMRVVTGRPRTPTPRLSDEISYLEFRPYWNVPDSITRRQLLPKIVADPEYLRRQRFDVIQGWTRRPQLLAPDTIDWEAVADDFPYRLRQRPGRHNSLGLVKFMFPNRHSVYLHDTPVPALFDRPVRAFSAGCVRVEDPVALADFLLRDAPAWSPATIAAAMDEGERRVVPLPAGVPVHLTYFTTFVDEGLVHFREDLYGLDEREGEPFSDLSEG